MPARFGRKIASKRVQYSATTKVVAGQLTPYVRFREPLRSTDSQGIGRSPGQRMPHKTVGFAAVPGIHKMFGLLHPDRRFTPAIERSGWSVPVFPEHRNRHSKRTRKVILQPEIAPNKTEVVAALLRKRPS